MGVVEAMALDWSNSGTSSTTLKRQRHISNSESPHPCNGHAPSRRLDVLGSRRTELAASRRDDGITVNGPREWVLSHARFALLWAYSSATVIVDGAGLVSRYHYLRFSFSSA